MSTESTSDNRQFIYDQLERFGKVWAVGFVIAVYIMAAVALTYRPPENLAQRIVFAHTFLTPLYFILGSGMAAVAGYLTDKDIPLRTPGYIFIGASSLIMAIQLWLFELGVI